MAATRRSAATVVKSDSHQGRPPSGTSLRRRSRLSSSSLVESLDDESNAVPDLDARNANQSRRRKKVGPEAERSVTDTLPDTDTSAVTDVGNATPLNPPCDPV
jgi:hypothetical protein